MSIVEETNLVSIGVILVGIFNIWLLIKKNNFMSAQGGLHVNLLVFYGLGPLANGFAKIQWDRYIMQTIPVYLNMVQWTILISYTSITLLFLIRQKKSNTFFSFQKWKDARQADINILTGVMLFLAIIGYFFAKTEAAKSGIGTIFVVLKNLLFPTLVLLIWKATIKDKASIFLVCLGFLLVGINAFISQWRSELLVFLFSIGAGLVLRNKRFFWLGLLAGPFFLLFILPFQNLKKAGKIKEDESYTDAFLISLNSRTNPFDMALNFVAYRLNYGRESAYVVRGIDRKYIDYRYGETYQEMFLQLIPRVLWPDKPSYNYYTGFVLPRKIGLSSKFDRHTSWGVNYFAEFLFNFPLRFLPIFFMLYWMILRWFDSLPSKMELSIELRAMLQFALFFQVLSTVNIVNAATYFLWIFIIIKTINLLLKKRHPSHENLALR
ncbi:MAG: hypothetical protein KF862_20465 [Chitinophagaceae bacterium]|nr:hypothetical protein [Chitinophagaceae bacterium]